MARRSRRRRRLGLSKSPQTTDTPGAPTQSEWEVMTGFGTFVVTDKDDQQHGFKQGDIVIILPQNVSPTDAKSLPLHEHWVAKIKEIRSHDDPTDVWTRVQWYWSGEDVHGLIKSFDASSCGMYERVLSDLYDLVHVTCISDIVTMSNYDEKDVNQPDIEEDQFFTRYTLEHKMRRLDPKPILSCICKYPYNPDTDTMHFCPRPSCRRYYHADCLIKRNYLEPPSLIFTRLHRLITCSPDVDNIFLLTDIMDLPTGYQPSLKVLLRAIPSELVAIAQQPIVKGLGVTSIVGNVRAVTEARRMIYGIVGGIKAISDDWEQLLGNGAVLDASLADSLLPYMCPQCWSPI